jgi:predicted dehydrogenase/nucleoside-diphosphate-sugar epimerase
VRTSTDFIILGGGAVVSEFYLPASAQLGWLERLRIADPSERAQSTIQRSFPAVDVVRADFRRAIRAAADEGFKAAIVALPNALHEEAVTLGFEHGLDVLCEKPLALSQTTCASLTEKAAAARRLLGVGMVWRLAPAVRAVRNAIDAGWIGEPTAITVSWGSKFAWPSESGEYFRRENAGVLANLGVHSLDLVQHLFGPLVPESYTDDWNGGVEANARFVLRTAQGAKVQLSLSYTTTLANEVCISGTAGTLRFDYTSPDVQFRNDRTGLHARLKVDRPFAHGDWPQTLVSCFAEQLVDFAHAVDRRVAPHATGVEATGTAALIDWAYAHHQPVRPVRGRDAEPILPAGRIVVTGGTGFVGGHLLERLVTDGHEDVSVLVRSHRSGANAGRFPLPMVRTNLLDESAVHAAMAGARYVFHLAYGRDGEEAGSVTTDGTRHVVNAAIAQGAEAVVVLSTTSLFGKADVTVDESGPYAPTNDYERQKAEAEQWTLARARTAGRTRVVVVNAACVYGPAGQAFTELPARLLKSGVLCWISDGRGIVNHVYVGNLVDAVIRAALTESAHGERFIVSDGSETWREFLGRLLGPATDRLPSYAVEDLRAMEASATPGSRDLLRALVANPELWRVIRGNPHFDKAKSLARRALPRLSRRVEVIRGPAVPTEGTPAPVMPPSWLGDLYGLGMTRVQADKARRVLGWTSRVDSDAATLRTRQWLYEVGLIEQVAR